MKTMFSNSVFDQGFFSATPVRRTAAAVYLGRASLSSMLPLNERTQVAGALQGITGTLGKLSELDAATSDMDRFNSLMGPDGAVFLKLLNEASALCSPVKALYDRLLFQDPGEWYADADEIRAMNDWTSRIERMYVLYAAHFPKPPPSTALPPGSPTCQAPAPAATGVSPGPSGGTTPSGSTVPGVPAGTSSAVPGSAPPESSPLILGMSTKTLLIGGGIVAGISILALVAL